MRAVLGQAVASLRVRFARQAITGAGIALSIAFFTGVRTAGPEIGDQWLPQDAQTAAYDGTLQMPLGMPLAEVERRVILATLEYHDFHKERTAAGLGISLKTLYNRLKEYGL